ncbi:hypothetical protein RTP6_002100 [Batrachochytrium dendrobatidis]
MDVTRILHGMDKVHSTTNCANPKDFQDKCELLKLFARWLIDDSDSAELKLWFNFFSPASELPLRLIQLQGDQALLYCISADNLPAAIRSTFHSSNILDLAPIFRSRLSPQSIQSTIGSQSPYGSGKSIASKSVNARELSSGYSVSPSNQPSAAVSSSPSIMLDMFEYYMFCFAFAVRLATSDGFSSNKADASNFNSFSRTSSRYATPNYSKSETVYSTGSNTNGTRGLAQCYFELVRSMLAFYIPQKPVLTKLIDFSSMVTPKKGGADMKKQQQPTQFRARDGSSSNQPFIERKLDKKDVFSCPEINSTSRALRVSEFVFSIFVELWLSARDDPQQTVSDRQIAHFVKPSNAQIKCISLLTRHLVSLDLHDILSENHGTQYKSELPDYRLDNAYDMSKATAYRVYRLRLYSMLRSCLESWPQDDTFESIVEIWITYITPWRAVKQAFSEKWGEFVKDNFVYYTVLLQIFMQKVQSLPFLSALRPTRSQIQTTTAPYKNSSSRHYTDTNGSSAYAAGITHKRCLEIVNKVLGVFSDPCLLQLLRVMETALSTLDAFGTSHGNALDAMSAHPKSATYGMAHAGYNSPSNRLPRTLQTPNSLNAMENPEWLCSYQNSGPALHTQIFQFERGMISYRPTFICAADISEQGLTQSHLSVQQLQQQYVHVETQKSAQKLAITLMDVSNRLVYYSTQGSISSGPSTPRMGNNRAQSAHAPHPPVEGTLQYPAEESSNIIITGLKYILVRAFGGQIARPTSNASQPFNPAQIDKLQSDISNIKRIVSALCKIWDMDLATDVMSQIDSATSYLHSGDISHGGLGIAQSGMNDLGLMGMEDEADLMPVGPGVFSPESINGTPLRLTRRGKEQIKRGFRKCSSVDVPIVSSTRAKQMHLSDESPFLVYVIHHLAILVDELFTLLNSFFPWVPKFDSEKTLRGALSSWKRMIGTIAIFTSIVLVFYISFWILKFLVWSGTSLSIDTPVQQRHQTEYQNRHQGQRQYHQRGY